MLPEVTILMPNYNNELFLKEAIDSILNQTFQNFIFLIVDDGSTDDSIKIIKNYNDKRIVLIQKEKNSGIVDTLNIGLKNITTKYYMRMDGDDISIPNRLELLYNFMENNPDVGVCGSNMKNFGKSTDVTNYSLNQNRIKARFIFAGGISHAGSIYKTSVFRDNEIYYTNNHPYLEDYDLFIRVKKYTNFANIPDVLYLYRLLEHNSTVKNSDTLYLRYKDIYKNILEELKIELTEKNINTHLEFFLGNNFTYKIKDYKNWIDKLINQNKKNDIYPQVELAQILNERWNNDFFYKTVPLPLNKILAYFLCTPKIKYSQINYCIKYKINKLIGRKQA